MLIDEFSFDWLDELNARVLQAPPSQYLYLLIDGAFVPGLHKLLAPERKAILFSAFPGSSEQAIDVSPFITLFDPADKKLRYLLRRCNRWPMLSVIETPETLENLFNRLSAWCVVEADGQRFNLRFLDTRRLPTILKVLNDEQRRQFLGPATRIVYIARDGCWNEVPVDSSATPIAADPVLDQSQFAMLAADSEVDELTVLLSDRGYDVRRHPSRSHILLDTALQAARSADLHDDALIDWCEFFWRRNHLGEEISPCEILHDWQRASK